MRLRRDPRYALLRHLSDLEVQYRMLCCLDPTPLPTPKPRWFERDPAILGSPFLVMERVPGTCPSPWGREGRAFCAAAAARGILPASFTAALATLHTLDCRAAGLDLLGAPGPGSATSGGSRCTLATGGKVSREPSLPRPSARRAGAVSRG